MKFKKLVFYDVPANPLRKQYLNRFKPLAEKVEVVQAPKEYANYLKPKHFQGVDAFIPRIFDNIPDKLIEAADSLRYVGATHTDISHWNLPLLEKKGITLCNVPHYSTEGVAELTISVLLCIARQTHQALNFVKAGKWGFENFLSRELKGKSLGVIGLGSIGFRVAEIAQALGMSVYYFSRTRKPEAEAKGVKYLTLEALLPKCDVVSLHTSLNKGTTHLLDKKRLALLKENAILLNPSRSELCDLEAVYKLAKKGRLTAWFDAVEEPGVRKKFRPVDRLLLTPHYGWMTREAQENLLEISFENAKKFLAGRPQNKIV